MKRAAGFVELSLVAFEASQGTAAAAVADVLSTGLIVFDPDLLLASTLAFFEVFDVGETAACETPRR